MTDQHLFIFNLGPIQSFIAEARRTRDLFMGSQILVELTRAAVKAVDQIDGVEWVYPCDLEQASLPNRFVALISSGQTDRACKAAEQAVRQQWMQYAQLSEGVLLRIAPPADPTWRQIWRRQIDTFPQVYWTVCPLPSTEAMANGFVPGLQDEYMASYVLASLGLNARKQVRTFEQTEERGEKDSLSGEREALHTKDLSAHQYWAQVAEGVQGGLNPSLVRPQGRERLDTLGTVKRFCPPEKLIPISDPPEWVTRFPSTSSFAAADFRRRLAPGWQERNAQNGPILEALNAHREAVQALGIFKPGDGFNPTTGLVPWAYDGDLLYESTFTPHNMEDDYHLQVTREQLAPALRTLHRLYGAAECRPDLYYAILVMDADDMSKCIAGIGERSMQDESGHDLSTKEKHQRVSRALGDFAAQVPQIVEGGVPIEGPRGQPIRLAGRVVYAGGDDVMALLPARDALPAAARLYQTFVETMAGYGFSGLTMSAGVALVHHKFPLDVALQSARNAEKAAKDVKGKDALCVYAIKRSGDPVRVRAKWAYSAAEGSNQVSVHVPRLIAELCDLFVREGPLSSRFAYDYYAEAPGLMSVHEEDGIPVTAFRAEIERLLIRHLDPKKVPVQEGEKAKEAVRRLAHEKAVPLAHFGAELNAHHDAWAGEWAMVPDRVPTPVDQDLAPQPGAIELGKWLLLARFVATGGQE